MSSENHENKKWSDAHAEHRYYVTSTGYPYPKRMGFRGPKGLVRKAFAKYAFAAANEGARIGDLDQVIELMKRGPDSVRMVRGEIGPRLLRTFDRLQCRATVDEVLSVLRDTDHYLDRIPLEIAWCVRRGWMRVEPQPKWELRLY